MVERNRAHIIVSEGDQKVHFEIYSSALNQEVQNLTVARLRSGGNSEFLAGIKREFVQKLLAAELFVNEDPPVFVIADNEAQIHNDLRCDSLSKKIRISGNIIEIKGCDCLFFSMDAVDKNSSILVGGKSLEVVAEFLLSQNIVPMDAEKNIIYPIDLK